MGQGLDPELARCVIEALSGVVNRRQLDAGKAPFDQALGAFVPHLLSIREPCIYRKLVARRVLQVERMRSLLLRRLSERSFLLHFFASPLIY